MRRSNRLATKSAKSYVLENENTDASYEPVDQEAFLLPARDDTVAFESVTPHVIQRRRITCSPRVVVFIASFVIVAMILFFPLNVEAVEQPRFPNFRRTTPPEPWLPSQSKP
jgi:hypothetical protein